VIDRRESKCYNRTLNRTLNAGPSLGDSHGHLGKDKCVYLMARHWSGISNGIATLFCPQILYCTVLRFFFRAVMQQDLHADLERAAHPGPDQGMSSCSLVSRGPLAVGLTLIDRRSESRHN
jgi:hypothetical protein